jgi:hypothetical protein
MAEQLRHTLFCTSLSFDLAVYESWVPLSWGAAVHLVNNALQLGSAQSRTSFRPARLQASGRNPFQGIAPTAFFHARADW